LRGSLCLAGGAGRGALCACDSNDGRAACPPNGRAWLDGRVFCACGALSWRGGFDVCELRGGEYVLAERMSDGRFKLVRSLIIGRFAFRGFSKVLLRLGEFAGR